MTRKKDWKVQGVWGQADGKQASRLLYTGPSRAEAMAVAKAAVDGPDDYLFADVLHIGPIGWMPAWKRRELGSDRRDRFYARYSDGTWSNHWV